jgi:hypothetical protein
MEYRLNKEKLLEELAVWNGLLKRRVRLIACGGTALTLLGIKLLAVFALPRLLTFQSLRY